MNPIGIADVTNYLRAFLSGSSLVSWSARVTIVYIMLLGLWEILDAWVENVKASADEFQIRGLNSISRDLEKLRPELGRIEATLVLAKLGIVPAAGEIALMQQNAVNPMIMGHWSVAARLVSLRNQLMGSGLQPISGTSILTSKGIQELLPSWSQPIPDWFSDQFLATASKIVVATEKSAPGEAPTPRDIGEGVVKEFAEKGKAAIKGAAEKISKIATPWITLALVAGLLYLAKK